MLAQLHGPHTTPLQERGAATATGRFLLVRQLCGLQDGVLSPREPQDSHTGCAQEEEEEEACPPPCTFLRSFCSRCFRTSWLPLRAIMAKSEVASFTGMTGSGWKEGI